MQIWQKHPILLWTNIRIAFSKARRNQCSRTISKYIWTDRSKIMFRLATCFKAHKETRNLIALSSPVLSLKSKACKTLLPSTLSQAKKEFSTSLMRCAIRNLKICKRGMISPSLYFKSRKIVSLSHRKLLITMKKYCKEWRSLKDWWEIKTKMPSL